MPSLWYRLRYVGTRHWSRLAPLPVKSLFRAGRAGFYSCAGGWSNSKFVPYTELADHIYSQLVRILKFHRVAFALFEGSQIGLVRGGGPLPWMDDIDIAIFKEDIGDFEEKVLPLLQECGFNCFPPEHFPEGGMHILGLVDEASNFIRVKASPRKPIQVRRAQLDVFYSEVDTDGFLRNTDGWGLYDSKQIPSRLVFPFREVEMYGTTVPVFSEYPQVVEIEYGDVMNNVVVQTHDRFFLQDSGLGWRRFEHRFKQIIERTGTFFPPMVSRELLQGYRPLSGNTLVAEAGLSLTEMVRAVIFNQAKWFVISDPNQIFWVMDLKRLLPSLRIRVHAEGRDSMLRAAQLRKFIDQVSFDNSDLGHAHQAIVAKLRAATGW